MAAAGGAGAGAAGGAMLDALVDWSKVSKDMMTCRDLYTAHLQSPIAELVRAFAWHRDIGLLQALPPLPLVPEDSESEDDYGAEDALAALAYERAKADAKAARWVECSGTAKTGVGTHSIVCVCSMTQGERGTAA